MCRSDIVVEADVLGNLPKGCVRHQGAVNPEGAKSNPVRGSHVRSALGCTNHTGTRRRERRDALSRYGRCRNPEGQSGRNADTNQETSHLASTLQTHIVRITVIRQLLTVIAVGDVDIGAPHLNYI